MWSKMKKGVKKVMEYGIEKIELAKDVVDMISSNDIIIRKIGVLLLFISGGLIAYSYVK